MSKKRFFITAIVLFCFSACLSSCVYYVNGSNCESKAQREFVLETEMADGMIFSADTKHGYIHVLGTEENRCYVTATVSVWAETKDEANEIADEVTVDFDRTANRIAVVVDKPKIQTNCGIYTDYEVRLPRNTHLTLKTIHNIITCENIEGNVTASTTFNRIECSDIVGDLILNTSHGKVKLDNIEGAIEAKTSFNQIECSNVAGDINLTTSHGKIILNNLSGQVRAKTSFSAINAAYITGPLELETSHGKVECREIETDELRVRTSFASVDVSFVDELIQSPLYAYIETSHGSIDFDIPSDFSGDIDMSTSHGKLNSHVPIFVKGEISEEKLSGTIGDGFGSINLKTTFGSITLK